MKIRIRTLGALAALALTSTAFADEQYFGYTYPAEGMPKGSVDIYQWNTYKTGRIGKPDTAINFSTEIEYGFTDRLSGSFYVDYDYFDGKGLQFRGLKTAWKYFFLTPAKNDFGLGVYLEPIWARTSSSSGKREDKWAIEAKVLLQKNFLDDQLIWATNLVTEFEWEREPGESWEEVLELQASTGLGFRVGSRWTLGVEALYEIQFDGFNLDQDKGWMIGVGPVAHYRHGKYWATLTWLPQVIGNPSTNGNRNLASFDDHQVRLKFGMNF